MQRGSSITLFLQLDVIFGRPNLSYFYLLWIVHCQRASKAVFQPLSSSLCLKLFARDERNKECLRVVILEESTWELGCKAIVCVYLFPNNFSV